MADVNVHPQLPIMRHVGEQVPYPPVRNGWFFQRGSCCQKKGTGQDPPGGGCGGGTGCAGDVLTLSHRPRLELQTS
ncbi:MAG: hypothetical protein GF311_27380 [Candidatus Lokiarchaeota archaeon]|nr:hypothetical protein [Candidatus Lokiarchaeota archaeon]